MSFPFAPSGQPAQPQFQAPPAAPAWDPNAQAPQTATPPAPAQPAPISQETEDTGSFFGGAPSMSFADASTRGQWRGGIVLKKVISQRTHMQTREPLFWDPNKTKPMMQLELTLQTAERTDPQDDGIRRLFVKGHMPKAIKKAIQDAGVPDVEIGSMIAVCWDSDIPPKTPGFNPGKGFSAMYKRPGAFDETPFRQGQAAPAQPAPSAAPPAQPQPTAPQIGEVRYTEQGVAVVWNGTGWVPQSSAPAPAAQFAPTPQPVTPAAQAAPPSLPQGVNPFG